MGTSDDSRGAGAAPVAHRVDVDGVALHVEEEGAGPAVLFGHSLLCNGTMFAAQVADLARDHRVLNVDFRGHGQSGVPPGPYTMQDQANDYLKVMDALGVDRAAIVGLSMGGMAAMRLAASHPDRVAALVLMDTSAGGETWWNRVKYGALAGAFARIGPRDFILKPVAKLMFGQTFRREQPDQARAWIAVFQGLDRQACRLAVDMVRNRRDVHDRLPRIAAPTLVIVGEEDVATPPALARRLAGGIPGARLEIVPAAGHLSTVEQPEATIRLIREHLAAVPW